MSELKSCPFCGAKAKHKAAKVTHCQLHGDAHQEVIIYCDNCKARPSVSGGDTTQKDGYKGALVEAAEFWNKRYSVNMECKTCLGNGAFYEGSKLIKD